MTDTAGREVPGLFLNPTRTEADTAFRKALQVAQDATHGAVLLLAFVGHGRRLQEASNR